MTSQCRLYQINYVTSLEKSIRIFGHFYPTEVSERTLASQFSAVFNLALTAVLALAFDFSEIGQNLNK